ncbi:MAG: hypothetical protein AMXMBFR64_32760 [Myxococcales bacterium]
MEGLMKVDHVVIGAGIAGIALRRALTGSVVMLDPEPAGYKIGESIIPEQFHHPLMSEALPDVRRCASYSPKIGTTFIGAGEVACFPLQTHRLRTMHIYRSEMEALLLERFGIEVRRERVTGVDVAARAVTTAQGVYESRGPIIDCSGPAMVVAHAIGEVKQLWPVHAVWGYYDVTDVDDGRFWRAVDERGWRSAFLDIPSGHLMPEHSPESFSPSRTTILVQLRPGTWMWQIPLWSRSRLSVGVVSRGEPFTVAAYRALVEEHVAPCYTLRSRGDDGLDGLDRIHRRSGFARRAHRAATEDYILLGDAFAFADPVYSVGTGLAVNKAIAVGQHLSAAPWTAADAARYCAEYDHLMERAVRAFDFWYSGEVMRDDSAAMEVQDGFLVGGAFQKGAFHAYASVVQDAAEATDSWLLFEVSELLGDASDPGPWRLDRVDVTGERDALLISWVRAAGPTVCLEVGPVSPGRIALRTSTGLRISHRGDALPGFTENPEMMALVDGTARAIASHPDGWRRVLSALHGSSEPQSE